MMEQSRGAMSLASVFDGWEQFNKRLVTLVAPLTPEQLALRSAPHQRDVMRIVGHIISARAWWFHEQMGEGDSAFARYYNWDEDDGPTLNAAQLEEGLEQTWRLIAGCLERWTTENLDENFPTSNDGERSRQWALWRVIEHDIFHTGEVSLILGSSGADTIGL